VFKIVGELANPIPLNTPSLLDAKLAKSPILLTTIFPKYNKLSKEPAFDVKMYQEKVSTKKRITIGNFILLLFLRMKNNAHANAMKNRNKYERA